MQIQESFSSGLIQETLSSGWIKETFSSGYAILDGDKAPPVVEMGLTDLPKGGGKDMPPPGPPLRGAWSIMLGSCE